MKLKVIVLLVLFVMGCGENIVSLDPNGNPNTHLCNGENGTTYYVREDGGNFEQCNGLHNKEYVPNSSSIDCAFSNPLYALPPVGVPIMQPGDRLVINNGHYLIGPNEQISQDFSNCSLENPASSTDCNISTIPQGIDENHPTCIVGNLFNTGCSSKPKLLGTGNTDSIINLTGTNHVQIECLELTDEVAHRANSDNQQESDSDEQEPNGEDDEINLDAANHGILGFNAGNIVLNNLEIHGLAQSGIFATQSYNWTIENSSIYENGYNGIVCGEDSLGCFENFIFENVDSKRNGCIESSQENSLLQCSSEQHGFGLLANSNNANYVISNSAFENNTNSGIKIGGEENDIVIDSTSLAANAQVQLDLDSSALLVNVVIMANCNYWPFLDTQNSDDICNEYAGAIRVQPNEQTIITVVNSTIFGTGQYLLESTFGNQSPNNFYILNSILASQNFTKLTNDLNMTFDDFFLSNSIVFSSETEFFDYYCESEFGIFCEDPLFVEWPSYGSYDFRLTSDSPAIDAGATILTNDLVPEFDFNGTPRDSGTAPDIGAYEYTP